MADETRRVTDEQGGSAVSAEPLTDRFPVVPPLPRQRIESPPVALLIDDVPAADQPPALSPRRGIALGLAVLGVLTVGVGLAFFRGAAPSDLPPPAASTPAQATATAAPAEVLVTVPNLVGMTGYAAQLALSGAGVLGATFAQNGAPMTGTVTSQTPVGGTVQRAGLPVFVTVTPPVLEPHRVLTAREWQVIAKNPDAHIGERLIVHGHVTQFDAATGTSAFRASIDGVRHKQTYEYRTNTVLRGTSDLLTDVVADDQFTAEVTVRGSMTYSTQIGGSATVPLLEVNGITVR
ncbi:serine/threonine protein kinase [Actinomycetes bacterium KLBMP 9759]